LVKAHLLASFGYEIPHALEGPQYADACDVSGVFRLIKRDANVGLGRQIVDFVRLNAPDEPPQRGAFCEIAIFEKEVGSRVMRFDV
jgi:hypothetical protein